MSDDLDQIREQFPGIAHESFPDNSDVQWWIDHIVSRAGFHCVEARPIPETVGYPKFRFVLSPGADGQFADVGCYCLRQGQWTLLYTAAGTSDEWRSCGFDAS